MVSCLCYKYADIIGSSIDPATQCVTICCSPCHISITCQPHSPPSPRGIRIYQQHCGIFRPQQWQQTMELPDDNTIPMQDQDMIKWKVGPGSSSVAPSHHHLYKLHSTRRSISHNISTNTISFKCDSLPKYKTCP